MEDDRLEEARRIIEGAVKRAGDCKIIGCTNPTNGKRQCSYHAKSPPFYGEPLQVFWRNGYRVRIQGHPLSNKTHRAKKEVRLSRYIAYEMYGAFIICDDCGVQLDWDTCVTGIKDKDVYIKCKACNIGHTRVKKDKRQSTDMRGHKIWTMSFSSGAGAIRRRLRTKAG